jgi:hypothetical protein
MSTAKWKFFTEAEVAGLDNELVAKLDQGRFISGVPYKLTSTVRSPGANLAAGGVQDSAHLTGKAADLHVDNSGDLFKLVKGLMDAGINRFVIGIHPDPKNQNGYAFHNLHVDIDRSKVQNILTIKFYA